MLSTNEIRQKYLQFFARHGHVVVPSSSLLPENDPTTLFTGSGMQPMISYLLGEKHPAGTRIADSQKCFRSQDIEEVGDNRHTTFFEMLGNWSLGDYFKKEQIPWMFQFLTQEVGLDPQHLYVTCFIGDSEYGIPKDEEAAQLWKAEFARIGIDAADAEIGSEGAGYRRGVKPGERIFYYEGKKNWWNRGKTGPTTTPVGDPCGPDSEMFYDFGTPHDAKWGEHCHPNCDCGRFMEIGNNVFMAYKKEAEGVFAPLPSPNIDHGSGLERIAAAVNKQPDVFRLDIFSGAVSALEDLTKKIYGTNEDETYAFRVILDHIRAATFLIGDGALPGNKDQGYFVRRLIRRAVRFAKKLGAAQAIVRVVSEAFIETYSSAYPNLIEKREDILRALETEESKFAKTVEKGIVELKKIFNLAIEGVDPEDTGSLVIKNNILRINGEDLFRLYETFGLPIELSQEIMADWGVKFDEDTMVEAQNAFKIALKKHQDLSRAGSEQKFAGGLADHSVETTKLHTATHLLHEALREVLGDHVAQKGSNITAERLRFDFSHGEKMTEEQIAKVEEIVNRVIEQDAPVSFEMLTVAEAKEKGAIGLFGDKYATVGDKIKVYSIGDFSKEICGGPHVAHTGELGGITIVKEEAVSAGVRRIKAVLGKRG